MEDDMEALNECIARWNADDKIVEQIKNTYSLWIKQMPENMGNIVKKLMRNFDYYSHDYVNRSLIDLNSMLQAREDVSFDNTVYAVLTKKEGNLNSGFVYVIEYQELNDISKDVIYPNFNDIIKVMEYVDDIKNIVLIDDFSGTGKTFLDFVKKYLEHLRNIHVYFLVVHIMENAFNKIRKFAESNGMNITVLYISCTSKAFSKMEDLRDKKKEFICESANLGISRTYALGYNDSEALVAFYNNTPNNTFGVFWMDTENHVSLIPRRKERRPSWLNLKKEREKRGFSNYMKEVENKNG